MPNNGKLSSTAPLMTCFCHARLVGRTKSSTKVQQKPNFATKGPHRLYRAIKVVIPGKFVTSLQEFSVK